MVVIDASVVVRAAVGKEGLEALPAGPFHAPALLWSEAASVLRQLLWRGDIGPELAREGLHWLIGAPITRHDDARLLEQAWEIAGELGWAKTYDAEYVALARFLGTPLVTADLRLARRAMSIVEVIGPTEV